MVKIAVLIPAFNEEKAVGQVVRDYQKAIPQATVYVYDNNSTDRTSEIAKKAGATVVFEPRQGKGNVIRSMFRQIDADAYVMTDADNTYPAEHAKQMVDLVVNQKFDMVIGDRLSSTYFQENKRPFHNTGNRLVRWLINLLFRSRVKDIMTGSRAFSYDFVKTFPVLSKGFEIETEMTIHALDKNMLIKEVPIDYRDRAPDDPSKLNTTTDGIKVIKMIFLLVKEYKPLFFFGWISLIFAIPGTIGILIPMVEFWFTHYVTKMPTLMVGILCMILALLSLTTGLILDVVARKNRQQFEISLNVIEGLRKFHSNL
ncbi:MAG: glycosyltransferase family 2 protein [Bifidobacteriaceae bacterium]|jgi:glycosyltransferase involved in cell wall biosynthesis|nr:glycosyltransferase family 2 protein [Bifidobacteriaceae bacterium]